MCVCVCVCVCACQSQWSRGLRRRSEAAGLLGLWVLIPPGTWMFVVIVVCCQVEVSAMSWSFVQRNPTDCSASLSVIYKPCEWGGPGPLGVDAPKKKYIYKIYIYTRTIATMGRVAQSVQRLTRLTMGWTVRGPNPGGCEIFRPSRPAVGLTQPPVQWVPGLSRG